jgi:hypothetical protein
LLGDQGWERKKFLYLISDIGQPVPSGINALIRVPLRSRKEVPSPRIAASFEDPWALLATGGSPKNPFPTKLPEFIEAWEEEERK